MKKSIKILYIVLCLLIALSPIILADTVGGVDVDPTTTGNDVNAITGVGNTIVGMIKVVGVFAAVAALMIVGVKYMMGSAEEKAEYKKVMIPYIIGAVLLFGASLFADKIANIATNLFK